MIHKELIAILIVGVCFLGKSECCIEKFANFEQIREVINGCYKYTGLSEIEDSLPKTVNEWLADSFDDKCFSKCAMKGLELLNEEDIPTVEKFDKWISANAPEANNDHMNIFSVCTEEMKNNMFTSEGIAKGQCKLLSNFRICYELKAEKLCKRE